jgi:hypothetical protein
MLLRVDPAVDGRDADVMCATRSVERPSNLNVATASGTPDELKRVERADDGRCAFALPRLLLAGVVAGRVVAANVRRCDATVFGRRYDGEPAV